MIDFSVINWIAVLVSAAAAFVLGAIWYGPVFGKMWMNLLGFKEEDLKNSNMVKIFTTTGIKYIIIAILIGLILSNYTPTSSGGYSAMQGAILGLFLGLILACVNLINATFARTNMKLYLLDAAHFLLMSIIMGAITGWLM